MIYGYEIKKVNNENILFLYMNFDYEFAKLNKIKKNLISSIEEYIKNNNVVFKGTKIALVVGGIVIGSILLNQPLNNVNTIPIDYHAINIIQPLDDHIFKNNYNESIIEEEDLLSEDIENIENSISHEDKKYSNNNNNNNYNNNESTIKQEVINQNNESIETSEENKINTNNSEIITLIRTNGELLNIELEEYIIGVVAAEMPALFHEQSLMAQAILARTYAYKSLENNRTLTDSSSTQNYKNNDELKNLWGNNYNSYCTKFQKKSLSML